MSQVNCCDNGSVRFCWDILVCWVCLFGFDIEFDIVGGLLPAVGITLCISIFELKNNLTGCYV
jgi:hypothetical protein